MCVVFMSSISQVEGHNAVVLHTSNLNFHRLGALANKMASSLDAEASHDYLGGCLQYVQLLSVD